MKLLLVLIVEQLIALQETVPTSVLGPLLLMLEQEIAARVMVPLTEKLPAASAPDTLRVPGIKQLPAVSIRKRVAPALLSRT